jgi:hypothetical protein
MSRPSLARVRAALAEIDRIVNSGDYQVLGQQKTVFIKDLGSASLFVREPIPVSIEVSEGQATACSYDLEQFGVGGDEFEALDDLRATIIELYHALKNEPNLGPLPRRQLTYLARALKDGP